MKKSSCFDIIEPLQELIYQYEFYLKGYKEKNNSKFAALLCDTLPYEIIYSSGYIPLRIPSSLYTKDCCSYFDNKKSNFGDLFDLVIIPGGCCNRDLYIKQDSKVFSYKNPSGFGDEFANNMGQEIERFLENTESGDLKDLGEVTRMYNIIRRQIRGIAAARKSNPGIISYSHLNLLFEAAMVLPPEIVNQYLNKITERIAELQEKESSGSSKQFINFFLYTSFMANCDFLDEMEELGFNIFEDDSCGGRRQFDISINHEADDLYKDIIHAYSFKPYCSSKRKVEERYESLYKLLKSNDAELVVFIDDLCCKSKNEHVDFLNIKLMRSGVDTIRTSSVHAIEELGRYREKALRELC